MHFAAKNHGRLLRILLTPAAGQDQNGGYKDREKSHYSHKGLFYAKIINYPPNQSRASVTTTGK